jgi:hypothetical protein
MISHRASEIVNYFLAEAMPIDRSWNGHKADYVSPEDRFDGYGKVRYSELAMHTGIAGKLIIQYALFNAKYATFPRNSVSWANVKTAGGKVTDGLPHEVLSQEIIQSLPSGKRGELLTPPTQKDLFTQDDSV